MPQQPDYSTLFFLNPLPSWVYDLNTLEFLEVNDAAVKHYGYTREEFLNMNLKDIRPASELPKLKKAIQKAKKSTGNLTFGEFIHLKKNKSQLLMAVNGHRLIFGERDAVLVICRDITFKKKEEHHLKLLESVIKHTKDAVMITEAEPFEEPGPKIIFVNDAFTKMTGYSAKEVIGQTPRILQGPKSDKKALANLGIALRNWESHEITTVNYKKDGTPFWINFSVSPVADESGWYTHWIAIERDVSNLKNQELEKQLLADISEVFQQFDNLNESLREVCKVIADFGEFSLAEAWLPNLQQTGIFQRAKYFTDQAGEVFFTNSEIFSYFEMGEGLPGAVWEERKPIIWDKSQIKTNFIRQEAATKANIRSLLGIPLLHNTRVIGALVIGSTKEDAYLQPFKNLFYRLEQFIGSEIFRKRQEEEYKELFNALPDLICITNFDGAILKVNPSGSQMLGYEIEELIGKNYRELLHPEDLIKTNQEHSQVVNNEVSEVFENRYITKSGEVIWLSWNSIINEEEGLIYSSAKNITLEKKLNRLYEETAALSKTGSWEIDLSTNKVFFSEVTKEIHEIDLHQDLSIEEGIGFYREDFKSIIKEKVEHAILTGEPWDLEAVIITAKGNEKWVRSIGEVEFLNEKPIRVFGSFQDIDEQKKIISQKENLLNTLESSLNEIYIFDAKTLKFNYVNHCALLNLGYSSDEIKELTPVDIKPNYALDDFKKLVAPLINHQENKIVFFTIHQRKNQSTYPVEVHLQLVEERGIQEFLAIILDITDRKKAEIDMLNALEEKKKILESIGDAFFAMDKNYKVTYWNQTAEKLLHVKKDNILNKNLWDVFPDAINLPSYHNYKKVMETGEAITFEDYYGKWFEVNAYPAEDGISVFFRDIDYKKEAELEILKANERFQKVAQATADAIWDWDIANDQFYRTDGFEALFGYEVKKNFKEAEFWQDSFYLEDIPKVKGSLKKALVDTTQEYWQAEYRIHHQTEGIKTVIDKGIIIRDESGKAIRMVGAMTDITDRIKQEQAVKELNIKLQKHVKELELSNEQLEQFAFITSHDLQEPLRMITSFMNQLQRKYDGVLDEKAHQYIHFATDGARRMKQIILDLLEYSRAGNAMEDQIEIDLNELFAQYKILRRKVIQEKDVQIINHGLPKINGPIAAVTQTLHCLLDNAVKYTKQNEPPLIEISAEEKSDHYIIQIKDHGIGIDAKFFDKIFIIFQRLHDKEQFDGTGLGLAVAKKHVDSWGGKIWVESTLGKGSSFYFTIKK